MNWYVLFFCLALVPNVHGAFWLNMSMADFVDNLLNRSGYDRRIRPGVDTGNPVIVYIDIFIMSISSIDDFNMDYSLNMYLRQTWIDERLKYSNLLNSSVTLNYDQISQLWIPDTFFRNLKKGMFHDITVPNRLIRLKPDGTILFSQRLSLTFDCTMYLEKYPFDNQTCQILIGSYGYTTDDMDLAWKQKEKPTDYKRDLQLPEFTIQNAITYNCTANFSTGSFACIYANIHFKRRFEYHLIQTYVPSTLIVLLSWVSFWIDTDAVPARISLGLLSVLTITTMASGTAARLPKVSYIKALDAWMVACLLFVFGALIEYSVVNVLSRRKKEHVQKQMRRQMDLPHESTPYFNMFGPAQTMAMIRSNNLHQGHECSEENLANEVNYVTHGPTIHGHHGNHGNHGNLGNHNSGTNGPQVDTRATAVGSGTRTETVKNNKDRSIDPYHRTGMQKLWDNKALLVDVVSRFFFPISFTVFNAFYWGLYAVPVDDILHF